MSQIQVPKGWNCKKISEIAKSYAGGTPKTGVVDYWENGDVPWLRSGELEDNFLEESEKCITKKGLKESSAKLWPPNTVLIALTGATTGKTGLLKIESAGNQSIVGILPCEEVVPKFLWYYLQYSYKHFWDKTVGGAQPHINGKIVSEREILYPNLQTQKKIVQKLDYILGQLEEKKKIIIELLNLEKTQQIISENIKHLLKTALEGKLTKDWRNDHKTKLQPSSILLEQILRNRREKWEDEQLAKFKAMKKIHKDSKWESRYKEPLTPASDLPDLPDLWTWVTLNQITWSVKDGPHYSPEYVEKGIPFISGGNVRPLGIDFINAKQISQKLHAELSKRCKPEKNDILYTKGGTTGIARVNTYEHEFNVWVHIAILKLVNPIEPFYVQHALNSPFCYSQAQNFTHGVGNQDLGLTRMIRIVLPLPPLEEQLEITKILDQKFAALEYVNNKINEIMTKKQSIINYVNKISASILNEAFTGKLVN